MIFDVDVYRTAHLMLRYHGRNARFIAAMWADRYADNEGGHALWIRIIQMIDNLEMRAVAQRQQLSGDQLG
ncbi:MAG TPA: hypothetical protein VFS04_13190 [Alphaproteobacteria bacterium]|nr:hypothetical protein [Alphaproteobacteria bacterium]